MKKLSYIEIVLFIRQLYQIESIEIKLSSGEITKEYKTPEGYMPMETLLYNKLNKHEKNIS